MKQTEMILKTFKETSASDIALFELNGYSSRLDYDNKVVILTR